MNLKSLIFFYRLISLTITLGCGATTFYFYCLQLPEHKGQVHNNQPITLLGAVREFLVTWPVLPGQECRSSPLTGNPG